VVGLAVFGHALHWLKGGVGFQAGEAEGEHRTEVRESGKPPGGSGLVKILINETYLGGASN
jgi:hypothetical protein